MKLVGIIFVVGLLSGAAPLVEVIPLGNVKSFPPIPPDQEIIFIGLEGLKYSRWVGCEFQRVGDIRALTTGCYDPETRTFPRGAMTALQEKARELGGDTVAFFNGCSSGVDALVFRRLDGDCQPILLFLEGSGQVLGKMGCGYEILGPLLISPIETDSSSQSYFGIIRGAFADSAQARLGEALWVTETDDVLTGRVLRFLDPDCKGWGEKE